MRDNTFSKKVFIKTVSDNLKNKYRKTIDDATQQELYQAVSEAVKDVIMDEWIATQRVMDKDDPKVVYYMAGDKQAVNASWPKRIRSYISVSKPDNKCRIYTLVTDSLYKALKLS